MRSLSAIVLSLLLLLPGCSFERNGVVHHIIVGVGVVSVPSTNSVAQVTRLRAIGVYAGNLTGPTCAAGYISSTVTTVTTNANVILELK